jgi:hypothetical protein
MVEVEVRDLHAAAAIDDVMDVAVALRALTGSPETGIPDSLLPSQEEWDHLSEQQRRIAVNIWYYAESAKVDATRRTSRPDNEA